MTLKLALDTCIFSNAASCNKTCSGKLRAGMCGEGKKCCKKYKRGKKHCKSCPKK